MNKNRDNFFQGLYGVDSKECVSLIQNNKHLFDEEFIDYILQNKNRGCHNRESISTKQPIGAYPHKSLVFYQEEKDGPTYCFLPSEIHRLKENPFTNKPIDRKKVRIYFESEVDNPPIPFQKLVKGNYCPRFTEDLLEDNEVMIVMRSERDFDEFLKSERVIDPSEYTPTGVFRKKIVEVLPGYKLYIAKLKDKNVSSITLKDVGFSKVIFDNKIAEPKSTFNKADWPKVYDFIERVKNKSILNRDLKFEESNPEGKIDEISSLNLKNDKPVKVYIGLKNKALEGVSEGEEYLLQDDGKIRVWTHSYCIASKDGYKGLVLETTLQPSQIVLDLTHLPKEYRSVVYTAGNDQMLVISKPGEYKTKVVNVHGGLKGDHLRKL